MKRTQHTIKLGEREFNFTGPLQIGQLQELEPMLINVINYINEARKGNPHTKELYEEIEKVILLVVNRLDPSFDHNAYIKCEATQEILIECANEIAFASQLWKKVEKKEGEGASASPNQPSPSSGEKSTQN